MMCINAWGGFKKMIGFCCTRVPPKLMAKMEEIKVRAWGENMRSPFCLFPSASGGLDSEGLGLE